ncbi:MAG TPA: hypothetical protein VHO03_02740 [Ignavibacteriales bacterium]|nr:hypothetical protein [Ignavibacteriales bacterium]
MDFLDLIFSLFGKRPDRKGQTASKRPSAIKKTPAVQKTSEVKKSSGAADFYRSGIQKFNSNEFNAAIGDFSQAVSLRRNFHQAYYNRGLSRLKIDDNNGAVLDFSSAIEIQPVYAKAYLNRGIAKNRLGDADGAQQDFLKSVEIDPQLYPLFTVRKVKINNETRKEDVHPEKPESAGLKEESLNTVSHEEAEEQRDMINDSEEDGFMNPLTIESEKEEYSSLAQASEGNLESKAAAQDNAESVMEDLTAEYKFDEPASEVESDNNSSQEEENTEDEEKGISSDDVHADEDPAQEAVIFIEEELKSNSPKEETVSEQGITKSSSTENPSHPEQAEKGPVKLSEAEYGESIEEIIKLFEDGEETGEEHDLSEYIEEEESRSEEKIISEAEMSNEELQEESVMRDSGILESGVKEREFRIELPEQNEIKRILHECLPDARINYARGYYYRAKQKYDSGDKAGAVQDYSNAIEFYSKFSQAYLQRGNVHSELDEVDEAISDYSKSIEYSKRNPLAYYNRALANQKAGKDREALADFTKAIIFEPRNPQLYLLRGMLRHEMGQLRSAFSDWSKAEILGSKQAGEMLKMYVTKAAAAKK